MSTAAAGTGRCGGRCALQQLCAPSHACSWIVVAGGSAEACRRVMVCCVNVASPLSARVVGPTLPVPHWRAGAWDGRMCLFWFRAVRGPAPAELCHCSPSSARADRRSFARACILDTHYGAERARSRSNVQSSGRPSHLCLGAAQQLHLGSVCTRAAASPFLLYRSAAVLAPCVTQNLQLLHQTFLL